MALWGDTWENIQQALGLGGSAAPQGSSSSAASRRFSDNTMKYGAPNAVKYSGLGGVPPSGNRSGGPSGPDMPKLWDYLSSLGFSPGDFQANLPEAPDLTAGVASQYSPVINYLQKSIGRTKNEGEEAGEDLGTIYGAMANMARQSGKTLTKQGKKSTKEVKRVYDQAERKRNAEIEGDTERVVGRLEDLGISQSLPASTQGMLKESGKQHRMFARQKAGAIGSSKLAADNWANFAKAGAQGARLEGAEAQAQLSSQVADAIFALRGQIAQSKAEKAAAMMQAQQAEYGMAMDASQAQNAAMMQKAGFAQQFQQMMMEQGAAGQGEQKDLEGYDFISSILRNEAKQEPGLNRGDAATTLEALQGMIPGMSPQGVDSYGNASNEMTQQDFYSQLSAMAEEKGLPPELVRALMSKNVYSQFYGS